MPYGETEDYLEDCADFGINPLSVKPMEYDPDAYQSPSDVDSNPTSFDDIWDV